MCLRSEIKDLTALPLHVWEMAFFLLPDPQFLQTYFWGCPMSEATVNDPALIAETKRKLEELGVKYCFAAYVDVNGVPKAKTVPIDKFEKMAKGSELFTVTKLENGIKPTEEVELEIKYNNGEIKKIKVLSRIDTKNELEYYKNGGILQYVLRNMI